MTLVNVHLFYGYPPTDLRDLRHHIVSYSIDIVDVPEGLIHWYYPFRLKRLLRGGRR